MAAERLFNANQHAAGESGQIRAAHRPENLRESTMANVNAEDPIATFLAWLEEAKRTEPNDPTAMTVASV
ncbi:MAG: hypothetical protein VW547_18130, partial [Alphaproteobacteria bacterium]